MVPRGPTGGTGGHPLHHPPQPAVRGKHTVTVCLHEAPLAIDLLVEDLLRHPPHPGDSPAPDVLDHRPSVAQALGVCCLQLVAFGPQPDALGTAAFQVCSLRGGTTSIPLRQSPPLIGLRGAGMAALLPRHPWPTRRNSLAFPCWPSGFEASTGARGGILGGVNMCGRDGVLGER